MIDYDYANVNELIKIPIETVWIMLSGMIPIYKKDDTICKAVFTTRELGELPKSNTG